MSKKLISKSALTLMLSITLTATVPSHLAFAKSQSNKTEKVVQELRHPLSSKVKKTTKKPTKVVKKKTIKQKQTNKTDMQSNGLKSDTQNVNHYQPAASTPTYINPIDDFKSVSANTNINPVLPYTSTQDDGDIANPNGINATGNVPWELDSRNHPAVAPLVNGNQIYYKNDTSSTFHDAVEQAVKNWNSLGVINLVPLPDNDTTDFYIHITEHNDPNPSDSSDNYGNTYLNFRSSDDATTALMNSANSILEPSADNKNFVFKTYVAEHEIGHSLGFAHDPYQRISNNATASHIMYGGTARTIIPLGQHEANALRQHYNLP